MATPDEARTAGFAREQLEDRLTVVLTTSPVGTHPSTRLLEEVFASIAHFSGAGSCPKIIVADGVKIRDGDALGDCKFRSGVVTKTAEENYRAYLRRVETLTNNENSILYGATLLILEQRHGFAHALRRGLVRVQTPFVLVAQHDRSFVKVVDLENVVDKMWRFNVRRNETRRHAARDETSTSDHTTDDTAHTLTSLKLNYVGFPTSTTITHAHHVRSKYGMEVTPFEFYDSMHVASTGWYLRKVFGRNRHCTLPKGGFIEDTLGQMMLADARSARTSSGENNVTKSQSEKWGVFLQVESVDDPGSPRCGHIDGRDLQLADASNRKFWFADMHTSEESWGAIERGTRDEGEGEGDEKGDTGENTHENVAEHVLGFFDPPELLARAYRDGEG